MPFLYLSSINPCCRYRLFRALGLISSSSYSGIRFCAINPGENPGKTSHFANGVAYSSRKPCHHKVSRLFVH